MNASQLVGHLFLSRNVAHSVHLNTRSFAKHSALQTFYDEIVDLTDKFAEAYQGRHGLIGPITVPAAKKTTNIVEFLQAAMTEVEEARYEVCEKTDTPIQNIIDEIVGLYLSTLYKLKFLA
jgi:glycerophosphoryl diester phosphodiesterase